MDRALDTPYQSKCSASHNQVKSFMKVYSYPDILHQKNSMQPQQVALIVELFQTYRINNSMSRLTMYMQKFLNFHFVNSKTSIYPITGICSLTLNLSNSMLQQHYHVCLLCLFHSTETLNSHCILQLQIWLFSWNLLIECTVRMNLHNLVSIIIRTQCFKHFWWCK